jgi:hypothetical protein
MPPVAKSILNDANGDIISIRAQKMPQVSRFYGIVIYMYCGDHPPPHFHAHYGRHRAQVQIDPLGLLAGQLPPRILAMVVEWAALHRDQLLANWELVQDNLTPNEIEGLP